MWILFALGSAFFAGLTSITAKCGIKKTDSTVATAIRTGVVLLCSAVMVTIVGSWGGITNIDTKSRIFLVLSGIATGASWLCYFKAISIGDVNKVVPLDKSSTVLAAVIAIIFLGESVTVPKITGLIAVTVGTYMMIGKKDGAGEKKEGLGLVFLRQPVGGIRGFDERSRKSRYRKRRIEPCHHRKDGCRSRYGVAHRSGYGQR